MNLISNKYKTNKSNKYSLHIFVDLILKYSEILFFLIFNKNCLI